MTTIAPGDPIPDALARRLASHYALEPHDGLTRLYYTGAILPGTTGRIARMRHPELRPKFDSHGRQDPNAVEAELRALEDYCQRNSAQIHPREDWHGPPVGTPERHEWVAQHTADSNLVVPWAWRAREETT